MRIVQQKNKLHVALFGLRVKKHKLGKKASGNKYRWKGQDPALRYAARIKKEHQEIGSEKKVAGSSLQVKTQKLGTMIKI